MAKPTFPVFPENYLKNKPPMSGVCPTKTKKQLLLLTIPIAIGIGVLAHFLGFILSIFGSGWLTMSCADSFGIASWMCMLIQVLGWGFNLLLLGYSVLIAVLVAEEIIGRIVIQGHCRNPRLAGWAGVICAAVIYATHLVIAVFTQNGLQPFIHNSIFFENFFDTTIEGTPWWLYVIMGVEFIALVLVTQGSSSGFLKNHIFCELHDAWYGEWKSRSFPFGIGFSIIEAFKEHDVSPIKKFLLPDAPGFPRVEVKMRGCPTGTTCDMEMIATFFWEELKRNDKGETSISIQNEQWFDLMVNAEFGHQMDQALQLKEPPPPEKKKTKSKNNKIAQQE
jgi:hypothetical protein